MAELFPNNTPVPAVLTAAEAAMFFRLDVGRPREAVERVRLLEQARRAAIAWAET